MRRLPAVIVAASLLGTALTGCAATGAAACPRPTTGADVLAAVNVDGSADAAPEVSVPTPFHTDATAVRDLGSGSGTPITTDSQLVVLDLSIASGATGEQLVSTPYDDDLSRVFPMTQWVQAVPGFEEALRCAAEGSRVVVGLAPGDIEPQTAASLGLAEDDSAVAVVDVRKVYLAKADGADQFTESRGLPTVVRAPDGRPGIIVPDADPPAEVVVQVLKRGTGPEVGADDAVRVHYTGLTWADREVFDSTWDAEPASLTLDAVVPGFAEALEGQTVGSQILAVIPPDQGYGDEDQGLIPAGSTLVFVIDILGIDEAAP